MTDFTHNDAVSFDQGLFGSFNDVMAAAHRVGHDTVIMVDASDTVTLENILPQQLHPHDFLLA